MFGEENITWMQSEKSTNGGFRACIVELNFEAHSVYNPMRVVATVCDDGEHGHLTLYPCEREASTLGPKVIRRAYGDQEIPKWRKSRNGRDTDCQDSRDDMNKERSRVRYLTRHKTCLQN